MAGCHRACPFPIIAPYVELLLPLVIINNENMVRDSEGNNTEENSGVISLIQMY